MVTIRVGRDAQVQASIIAAAAAFEARLGEKLAQYRVMLVSGRRLIATERRVEQEIVT